MAAISPDVIMPQGVAQLRGSRDRSDPKIQADSQTRPIQAQPTIDAMDMKVVRPLIQSGAMARITSIPSALYRNAKAPAQAATTAVPEIKRRGRERSLSMRLLIAAPAHHPAPSESRKGEKSKARSVAIQGRAAITQKLAQSHGIRTSRAIGPVEAASVSLDNLMLVR